MRPEKRYVVCAALFFVATAVSLGEHTRRWRQSTYDEFLKGTAHGVAVRSDGKLELAPKFMRLADADASYLWAVRIDPKGNVYAAGGTPAKVFRLDAGGKMTAVFESPDLSAQAIAFDSKGTLFVATNPDGKVYRVGAAGEKSVFFEPKTKYIWDLAFGNDGTLYVATGDKGQIYAVAPDGKGELFYSSDEAHIRVLAFDRKANLIAGTEPSGRILRLTRGSGKKQDASLGVADGFVLYETPKREVTALAIGDDNSIYASAIGERPHTAQVSGPVLGAAPGATTTITSGGNVTVIGPTSGLVQGPSPYVPFPTLASGSVYKILPGGAPEEVWTSREDLVYALAIGSDGRLLAGTGNNGTVLAIDGRGVYAQLAKVGSSQVTGIARNSSGKVFLCTANPGKLGSLGPEYEQEGTFESRSFDAQLFSQWGRIDWYSPPPAAQTKTASDAARLEFFVRSGNTEDPGKEWSRWFGPYTAPGSSVEAPPARFAQWKAVIHAGSPGDGIDWVSLAYEPGNVAPVIDAIQLQDPGVRAQGIQTAAVGQAQSAALRLPPMAATGGGSVITAQNPPVKFEAPPQGFQQKGWQSVLWSAHDDNEDDLHYAIYFRGEAEKDWKLLKDKLDVRFFAFDTATLADGAYYLKVVADDSQSNAPANAKTTERESERFEVDNTPPAVKIEAAAPEGGSIVLRFQAKDNMSSIDRAQYSLDGADWIIVAPKSGISDSNEESYEVPIMGLKPGEHSIAVRAYDRFENLGAAKTTVTVGGARQAESERDRRSNKH